MVSRRPHPRLSQHSRHRREEAEETDPFDTHPCLGDRLAALDAGDNRQQSTASTEPAAALIGQALGIAGRPLARETAPV
jgi:hypothetical protein